MKKYNILITPSAALSRNIVGVRLNSKEKQMLNELKSASGCKTNSAFMRQIIAQMHRQEFGGCDEH